MFYDASFPQQPVRLEHRFFFALLLPPQLARQIANAADWFREGGRAVSADRLHITLFILPDFVAAPAELIARLKLLGEAVSAAPVDIVLDYESGGGRSIALRPQHRIAGLTALYRDFVRLCPGYGIEERPGYASHPHVTLGYRDGQPFGRRIAPLSWTATEFVLIHSHLGQTRHEVLGRWPLIGPNETQLDLF